MKIVVLQPIEYDGRTYAAGLHDVNESDADAIFARGPARPATVCEIEEYANADAAAVETASASPDVERADAAKKRVARRAAA